jgi:hypothetical protein
MTRLIETSNAEWVPGTRDGHHGGCFGFIVDELCYEDLCQSPAKKTQWLFHALGLSWPVDVLQDFSRLHAGATSNRTPLALLSDAGLSFESRSQSRTHCLTWMSLGLSMTWPNPF